MFLSKFKSRTTTTLLTAALALAILAGCAPVAAPAAEAPAASADDAAALVVYSGRSENLVAPLLEMFEEATGINVETRYGSTSEMAATILEEGQNSPADVFFGQDAGALGALAREGRLAPLPEEILSLVPAQLRSDAGTWVGASGRARVLAYNVNNVSEADLPADVYGLTDAQWKGRIAWAPSNGSFQSFVTALRLLDGEDKARQWLLDMIANDVQSFENNDAILQAVGAGEVDAGLVNHYYLYAFKAEQGESFPVENYFFTTPGAGSIVNVAGAGILDSAAHPEAAQQFVAWLLSPLAQEYFAVQTNEYPLAAGIAVEPGLKPLSEIAVPELDLSNLDDLQRTLTLLQETGALQ